MNEFVAMEMIGILAGSLFGALIGALIGAILLRAGASWVAKLEIPFARPSGRY